jgi:hypothetical protein
VPEVFKRLAIRRHELLLQREERINRQRILRFVIFRFDHDLLIGDRQPCRNIAPQLVAYDQLAVFDRLVACAAQGHALAVVAYHGLPAFTDLQGQPQWYAFVPRARRFAEREAVFQPVRAVDVPFLHAAIVREVDGLFIAAHLPRPDGLQCLAVTEAVQMQADIGFVVDGNAHARFGDVSVIAR